MDHPQPGPTPVTTDNSTTIGLTLNTMTPKASKSMGMRYNGNQNRADYPSKHHSAAHHNSDARLLALTPNSNKKKNKKKNKTKNKKENKKKNKKKNKKENKNRKEEENKNRMEEENKRRT
eukprot:CCRYP_000609-RA/>CCRYP_000609-RA protein AED:0.74 eAED:0.74 QI:0/0/0/0.5/0.66/0.5/4/0/119